MVDPRRLEDDEIRRAVARVEASADADAWAELAFDHLSQQAEGRQLLAAPEPVARRVTELGLDADAEPARLLARGAQSPAERDLIAAYAVRGLGLGLDGSAGDHARVARFLRHADWLELSTPYEVYVFVDASLEPADAAAVWRTLGEQLARAETTDPAGVAALALRLATLARSESGSAAEALAGVFGEATSPQVRALAAVFMGGIATPNLSRLEGPRARPLPSRWRHALALVSGYALLRWLFALVAFAVGLRRRASLALSATSLEVCTEDHMLGRVIRSRRESRPLREVTRLARGARYPSLHLLVGAISLAAGILFGGLNLFDGVRTGETVLLLAGAGLVLGGGLLDLALSTLWPARKGEVVVELHFASGAPIAVGGLTEHDADAFVDAAATRLR